MVDTTKRFKSFSEFPRLLAEENPPLEGGQRWSLPVPTRRQGQLLIAIMFYPAMIKPGPVEMWPPDEVAWLDPTSGKLIASAEVSPVDFGQTHLANEPFPEWEFSLPPGMTVQSYEELHEHFFALYDVLFEAWATNPSTRSAALQSAAREFLKLFDQINEPPLRPYYDALGREYFEWVQILAK
jgi:hypothetical protein